MMVVIAWEFVDPGTIAISAEERLGLMRHLSPSGAKQVWVAGFEGGMISNVIAKSAAQTVFEDMAGKGPHIQVTTFTIGKAVFHSISLGYLNSIDYLFEHPNYGAELGLTVVWPPAEESLSLPQTIVSVEGAQAIADNFGNLLKDELIGSRLLPPRGWTRGPVGLDLGAANWAP
jgi:hypothetical protein